MLYQLSYVHHGTKTCAWRQQRRVARPAGLEPATVGLEGRCSIQLSYGRSRHLRSSRSPRQILTSLLVGVEGFEPPTSCSQSRRATRLRYTPRPSGRMLRGAYGPVNGYRQISRLPRGLFQSPPKWDNGRLCFGEPTGAFWRIDTHLRASRVDGPHGAIHRPTQKNQPPVLPGP